MNVGLRPGTGPALETGEAPLDFARGAAKIVTSGRLGGVRSLVHEYRCRRRVGVPRRVHRADAEAVCGPE